MEIWKPIKELPGYSVSNKGRVKKDENGQIMITSKNSGYVRITVTKHIHRLVAEAFIKKPTEEGRYWVDHINGNRSDNRVENLRWVTPSENATAFGYKSRIEHKKRPVLATNIHGDKILFKSRQDAAAHFKCSDSEIAYNHWYMKGNKKGWIFEKVKDIV